MMINEKLQPCLICGGQVSSKAMKCPHCGDTGPLALANQRFLKSCLMAPLFAVGILGVTFVLIGLNHNAKKPVVDSEARKIARQVKAELDTTTLEQLMVQIPHAPISQTRNGEKREVTWAYTDGSRIVAIFKPKGIDGSERGLILYSIDIKE